jgi:hypothetical protein
MFVVEILVGAGLVLAGAAAARMILRRKSNDAPPEKDKKKAADAAKKKAADAAKKKGKKDEKREPTDGPRGLRVGDVLLYADTELWLAGMIELDEEGLVARVFPTPGGMRAEWVAQLDESANDVATLAVTDEVPAGPVPEALPIGGRRLSLERRGQAIVRVDGEHLPRTSPQGRYVILSDAGGRVLVVIDFEKAPRLALVGDRLERHMVDLLPGGDLERDS